MRGFIDETIVTVASGHGGAGAVSFRREKYIPRGGPDGGDGGNGGHLVFHVRQNLKTLSHLRGYRIFRAENGGNGTSKNRHGKNGEDRVIAIPPGTILRDEGTQSIIRDFAGFQEETWTFLVGGKGGYGNTHFKGPIRRAPMFAQPGAAGVERILKIELNLIADAGFVGKPNAGKSTLLSVLTRARPKVAAYPFTTLVPHLGVMSVDETEVILADIPGLIEGASQGAGLGIQFLKHIARSAMLVYLVDVSEEDCVENLAMLRNEVAQHSAELAAKRSIVVATKLDITGAQENLALLEGKLTGERVLGISAVTGQGLPELRRCLVESRSTAAVTEER